MTPSQTLLTKVKTQHGLETDWQLHKVLGCTLSGLRRASRGHGELSTDLVLVACELIQEDPQPWLLRVELKRCKSPKSREILERILARLEDAQSSAISMLCAALLLPFF